MGEGAAVSSPPPRPARSRYAERRELSRFGPARHAGQVAGDGLVRRARRGGRHRLRGFQRRQARSSGGRSTPGGRCSPGAASASTASPPGSPVTPIIEDNGDPPAAARTSSRRSRCPFADGEAAEQAEVLAFLASLAASYVNGQVIWSDGGYLAGVECRLSTSTAASAWLDRRSIPRGRAWPSYVALGGPGRGPGWL